MQTVADIPAAGQDADPLVALRDVTFRYGPRPGGVDGVTLAVRRGEAVALVGRSGAGKSTLLKLVNGLLLPQRGSVLVEGTATIAWDRIRLRRRTGYVLQGIGLFPHLSVSANVALVPTLEGWERPRRDARAAELLALVGLPPAEYGDRWPSDLSGGQQQRVGVARALAASPPLLLMDEPFGALDPITRRELHAVVLRIQRDLGLTLLIVTHDMAEACALATRVGVLDAGALVACDTPAALAQSTDARVRHLFDAATTAGPR